MFDRYRDRIFVAEMDANKPVEEEVDIVLYDSFAQQEADEESLGLLIANPRASKVVVYTWNFHPDLISRARELVAALEAVHAGEIVVSEPPGRERRVTGLDWPGRGEGLTERESEVLALITQGHTNSEVAGMTYLSPNTVKSYIRNIYRKIGVSSRTQAVLWGVRHGFTPDHHRIDTWRGDG